MAVSRFRMAFSKMGRTFYAVIFSFIALALLVTAGCKGKEVEKAEDIEPVRQAIPFKLTTFDGNEWSLEAMKGKVVVINFWASWCGPCRSEAPELQKAYIDFNKDGVEFIGIAVQDSVESAKGFIEKYGLTFPTGLDESGEVMKAYGIYAVPTTYLIGRDGVIKHVFPGAVNGEDLGREIRKIL